MSVGVRPGTQTKECIDNYFKCLLGSRLEHKQKYVYIIILNECCGQARNTNKRIYIDHYFKCLLGSCLEHKQKYVYIIILNECWGQARNTNKRMYR